ncbi:pentatricopeptide repeat-containing protein At1g07590, mitochondrial-like isoform X3 [Panicum virgatum]|uniref:Pentatricopeptide repeat-containing protein n=1 Tax=Panicum virgatum TaxID=38727 RepID=A0A8T0QVJ3_PANVG|nr:pentatricopeptide repeat-containing protein At1g07590, mitochondrial-like isoform X3 [Panicum virgatum]KAG2576945.1 hypothetical protein PVAP13_6NG065300 [Panicum virgatum]
MLLLRALLRRRRPPLPAHVPAAGFFTSSGCDALVPSPPSPPQPPPAAEGPRDEPGQEGSLARRVERAASVCAAMRGWMADGRAVHRGHVFHAVNRLRRHRQHRTALQVMEWIMRERPYKLRIPERAALQQPCHRCFGSGKTISKILSQMKADRVTPHTSTYNILLKIQANEHNIDGVARVFNDMKRAKIEPSEITYGILAIAHAVARLYTVCQTYVEAIENSMTGTNWSTLEILLILYGYLGKEKELKRTWEIMQGLPHIRSKSFILAIEAFGKVGSIEQAEKIWVNINSTKKLSLTEQFNSILSVYCRHGIVDKASAVFKEMRASGCQPNAITYRHLALGCLKSGLVKEALNTMDMGKKEVVTKKVRSSTPWLETTHMLLENFAEIGDLENAKRVYGELSESKYCRNSFVYNTLLKAYVKAKVYEPDLLRTMILRGAMPDAETYSLLRLIEQFKI